MKTMNKQKKVLTGLFILLFIVGVIMFLKLRTYRFSYKLDQAAFSHLIIIGSDIDCRIDEYDQAKRIVDYLNTLVLLDIKEEEYKYLNKTPDVRLLFSFRDDRINDVFGFYYNCCYFYRPDDRNKTYYATEIGALELEGEIKRILNQE